MTAYSNSTTDRLEGTARRLGLDGFGVLKSDGNSAGVFFCVRLDGRTLSRWIALGWTVAEARESVERLATGAGLRSSATGYTVTVEGG